MTKIIAWITSALLSFAMIFVLLPTAAAHADTLSSTAGTTSTATAAASDVSAATSTGVPTVSYDGQTVNLVDGSATIYVQIPTSNVLPTTIQFSDGTIASVPWVTATNTFSYGGQSVTLTPRVITGTLKNGTSYSVQIIATGAAPTYPLSATATCDGSLLTLNSITSSNGNSVSVTYNGKIQWVVNYEFQLPGAYTENELPSSFTLSNGQVLPMKWKPLSSIGAWETNSNDELYGWDVTTLADSNGVIVNYYAIGSMTQSDINYYKEHPTLASSLDAINGADVARGGVKSWGWNSPFAEAGVTVVVIILLLIVAWILSKIIRAHMQHKRKRH